MNIFPSELDGARCFFTVIEQASVLSSLFAAMPLARCYESPTPEVRGWRVASSKSERHIDPQN